MMLDRVRLFVIPGLLAFGCLPGSLHAQQPNQLLIPSYDNTAEFVYFCEGQPLNSVDFPLELANQFYKTDPHFVIDSIVYGGNLSSFQHLREVRNDTLGGFSFGGGGQYSPSRIGDDTLTLTGYYGPYRTFAQTIFHARPSPSVGLDGLRIVTIPVGFGQTIINTNEDIVTDTLHDQVRNGASTRWLPSNNPQLTGGNKVVTLVGCGGRIDSIGEVGDFSEITFDSLPATPFDLAAGQTITIPFSFIPQVIGRTNHYLIFHAADGNNLVWSFEYEVISPAGVSASHHADDAWIEIMPNPSSEAIALSNIELPFDYAIFAATGINVLSGRLCDARPIDVRALPSGAYLLRAQSSKGTRSAKFAILR